MLPAYKVGKRKPRILDFDIECRPGAFYGGDFVTRQVTAIAWAWTDEEEVFSVLLAEHLGHRLATLDDVLDGFLPELEKADVLTGHHIRGFDLPTLNAQLLKLGRPGLPTVMTEDTKGDLDKMAGISKSQENLGAALGLEAPKVSMNTSTWEAANFLTTEGLELVRERAEGDVRQHLELRRRIREAGFLGRPRAWVPRSSTKGYQP